MQENSNIFVGATSGIVNALLAGANGFENISGIVSLIVSILSGALVVIQLGKILYNHFHDKHGKDCDCPEKIKDILDGGIDTDE